MKREGKREGKERQMDGNLSLRLDSLLKSDLGV
jgi:hypothetical protein